MIILVFGLIAFFAFVIAGVFVKKTNVAYVSVLFGVITTITFLLLVGRACHANLNGATQKAALSESYKSLCYQLEYNLYEGDEEKKHLYDEIEHYNMKVAEGKAGNESIWMGIFYPDIYDDLKIIKLPEG